MRRIVLAFGIATAIASHAATAAVVPVGVSTGDVVYGTATTDRGAFVDVGTSAGDTGNLVLSGGEVLVIESATVDEVTPRAQPSATFGQQVGAIGTVLVTGSGTEFQMIGDNTGATLTLGRQGGTGTLTVSDGALLRLFDDQNTSLSSTSVQLGREGGRGTFIVDNAQADIESTSDAFIFVGANSIGFPPPSGSGTVLIRNGSTVLLRDFDNGLAKRAIPTAGIVIGQEDSGSGRITIDASDVTIDGETANATIQIAREENTSGHFEILGGSTVSLTANSSGDVSGNTRSASLTIGTKDGSSGRLLIDEGSVLSMSGPNTFIGIGREDGSVGRLTVQGGGTTYLDCPQCDCPNWAE